MFSTRTLTAAKLFFDINPSLPQEFFEEGGTLEEVIIEVKRLVSKNAFETNPMQHSAVKIQLPECIKYAQQHAPNVNSVSWVWQKIVGKQEDHQTLINEANALWLVVKHSDVSPLHLPVVFGSEKPLAQIVDVVGRVVMRSDNYIFNEEYRKQLRDHLYFAVRKEYEFESGAVLGVMKRVLGNIGSLAGMRTAIDQGIELIKALDADNCICLPYVYENMASFKVMAYLTDAELLNYVTRNHKNITGLDLRGCFQLTPAGIEQAVQKLKENKHKPVINVRYPNEPLTQQEIVWYYADDWILV